MKKIIFSLLFIAYSSAEVSAFEAGNLDSTNPYGLTKDEKYILANKKEIAKLKLVIDAEQKEIDNLKIKFLEYKQKTDDLVQKMEGLSSILPPFANATAKIEKLEKEINRSEANISNLVNELNNLKLVVFKNQEIDKNNTQKIITLIEDIAKRLDKQSTKIKNRDFKKLSLNKIFALALKSYRKHRYSDASEKFYYLYKKKYRVSETLFYLGEVYYRRGHYKTALAFYKKSISNMKKATYFTDDLLYHTGYAFERLKNYEAAKKSYLKLINDFPTSNLVKYAKKRLQNLEKTK